MINKILGRQLVLLTLAALTAALSGCSAQLRSVASGQIGCPPDEIEISDVNQGLDTLTWTATCRGVRHYCTRRSATGVGLGTTISLSGVACTAELDPTPDSTPNGPAAAPPGGSPSVQGSSPAATATGPSASPPPSGAAGFTFGEARDASEKACKGAGKLWTDDAATQKPECSGPATDIGSTATVRLNYCEDKLCAVTLIVPLSDDNSSLWVNQYRGFAKNLVQKYGPPQEKESERVPCEIQTTVRGCFEDGRLVYESHWQWADAHSIRLVLGRIEGKVQLALVYRSGSDKKVLPSSGPPAGL